VRLKDKLVVVTPTASLARFRPWPFPPGLSGPARHETSPWNRPLTRS
jgi:hypothetical protein